jgi:hypothetical protein
MNLMKNRQGFKYPVDLAKRLQQQAAEEFMAYSIEP